MPIPGTVCLLFLEQKCFGYKVKCLHNLKQPAAHFFQALIITNASSDRIFFLKSSNGVQWLSQKADYVYLEVVLVVNMFYN